MRKKVLVLAAMLLLLFSGVSHASISSITIDVTASSAPNAFGSPSWSGYVSNALYALERGLSSYGDRSLSPTGYEAAPSQVDPWEIAVTTFNSWRGDVNPTGAFANELGNRMHFGLHAYGNGSVQFALNNLTFALHSSDPGDELVFTGNFVGDSYSATRYGINWGVDRIKGTSDDIIYNSGDGTTLVDEIVYVGVGNAWWPGGSDPTPGNPAGGAQAAMDDYYAWVVGQSPIDVTCTYNILDSSGSGTVTVTAPVPVPATLLLLGSGLAGLAGFRKRFRRS